ERRECGNGRHGAGAVAVAADRGEGGGGGTRARRRRRVGARPGDRPGVGHPGGAGRPADDRQDPRSRRLRPPVRRQPGLLGSPGDGLREPGLPRQRLFAATRPGRELGAAGRPHLRFQDPARGHLPQRSGDDRGRRRLQPRPGLDQPRVVVERQDGLRRAAGAGRGHRRGAGDADRAQHRRRGRGDRPLRGDRHPLRAVRTVPPVADRDHHQHRPGRGGSQRRPRPRPGDGRHRPVQGDRAPRGPALDPDQARRLLAGGAAPGRRGRLAGHHRGARPRRRPADRRGPGRDVRQSGDARRPGRRPQRRHDRPADHELLHPLHQCEPAGAGGRAGPSGDLGRHGPAADRADGALRPGTADRADRGRLRRPRHAAHRAAVPHPRRGAGQGAPGRSRPRGRPAAADHHHAGAAGDGADGRGAQGPVGRGRDRAGDPPARLHHLHQRVRRRRNQPPGDLVVGRLQRPLPDPGGDPHRLLRPAHRPERPRDRPPDRGVGAGDRPRRARRQAAGAGGGGRHQRHLRADGDPQQLHGLPQGPGRRPRGAQQRRLRPAALARDQQGFARGL
ncbi:MAG: Oligopeptide ABC transporter, periplasmic oligopeptide-binding protein OppA, partial [uncultured Thermomicrobiales bacterium]